MLKETSVEIPISIDDIILHYEKLGLLAHQGTVRKIAGQVRDIPLVIPPDEIMANVSQLAIWPFNEMYKISRRSMDAQINSKDREKLEELRLKQKVLAESEDLKKVQEHLDVSKHFDIYFLNPYRMSREDLWKIVLSVKCPPLEAHVRNTNRSKTKILHDAQMGGTVYIIGVPKRRAAGPSPIEHGAAYSFMQRSFVCIDTNGSPVLFMDNVEGGNPYFRYLDHWRGTNQERTERLYPSRIHEVYYAMASAMIMAEKLGLEYIVPRDFELVELARLLGMREKTIFSERQHHWKIGLHSKKKLTGIYTHALYRAMGLNHEGHQLRHVYFTKPPFQDPAEMLVELKSLDQKINETNCDNANPAPKTYQMLNTLTLLNDMINAHPLTTQYVKDAADASTRTTLTRLGPFELTPR